MAVISARQVTPRRFRALAIARNRRVPLRVDSRNDKAFRSLACSDQADRAGFPLAACRSPHDRSARRGFHCHCVHGADPGADGVGDADAAGAPRAAQIGGAGRAAPGCREGHDRGGHAAPRRAMRGANLALYRPALPDRNNAKAPATRGAGTRSRRHAGARRCAKKSDCADCFGCAATGSCRTARRCNAGGGNRAADGNAAVAAGRSCRRRVGRGLRSRPDDVAARVAPARAHGAASRRPGTALPASASAAVRADLLAATPSPIPPVECRENAVFAARFCRVTVSCHRRGAQVIS